MSDQPFIFACSMHFTTGDYLLIGTVVALWMISALLILPNLCLFAFVKRGHSFKTTHCSLFLAYLFPMIALVAGWVPPFNVGIKVLHFAVFVFPIATISHFIYLVLVYRRNRPKKAQKIEPPDEDRGPRCVACGAPIKVPVRICPSCGWTQPEYDQP
jgi:hypothetical protein